MKSLKHPCGPRVRRIRRELDWTQSDLCARLAPHLRKPLSIPTLCRIERGERLMTDDEVFACARVFDRPAMDILGTRMATCVV